MACWSAPVVTVAPDVSCSIWVGGLGGRLAEGRCPVGSGSVDNGAAMIKHFLLAGALLTAGDAAATEVTIQFTKVTLVAPKGFCPLDWQRLSDSRELGIMQQIA